MENEILPTGLPIYTASAMEQYPIVFNILLIILTLLKLLIVYNCVRVIIKKSKLNIVVAIISIIMFIISLGLMLVGYVNIDWDIVPIEDNIIIGVQALLVSIIIDTILNIILFYRIKLKNKVVQESEAQK